MAAYQALGAARHAEVMQEGLPYDGTFPAWSAQPRWHWKQTYPPGKVARVKHVYATSPGYTQVRPGRPAKDLNFILPDHCAGSIVDAAAEDTRRPEPEAALQFIPLEWVRCILLTANTWKRPIERISPTAVRTLATKFVSKRDLTVYFAPAPR